MIKTFRHKGLKQLFDSGNARAVAPGLVKRAGIILDYLDTAKNISELYVPGLRLHQLKGSRKGIWSVTISGNWRMTFSFRDGDAYDVDLEDYH